MTPEHRNARRDEWSFGKKQAPYGQKAPTVPTHRSEWVATPANRSDTCSESAGGRQLRLGNHLATCGSWGRQSVRTASCGLNSIRVELSRLPTCADHGSGFERDAPITPQVRPASPPELN